MQISNTNSLLTLMLVGCKGNMYCVIKETERTCSYMNIHWLDMSTNLLKEQAFLHVP